MRITPRQLYLKKPFQTGVIGGMTKRRIFEPDLFFSLQWDQIYYERGYHFSGYLLKNGVRLKSLPSRPSPEVLSFLQKAVNEGAII